MSDIRFFADGIPTTPPAGFVTIFVDPADDHLKQVDSVGTVIDLTGAQDSGFIAINNSGATIPKGSAVHFSTWDDINDLPEIVLADASLANKMPAIGIATSDILDTENGVIIFEGIVDGIDTTAFIEGQNLFVSTTPGGLTATRPTGATDLIQIIADAGEINITTGTLLVHGSLQVNSLPNLELDHLWVGNSINFPVQKKPDEFIETTSPATALITGGALSINVDSAKVDIAAGNGKHLNSADPNNLITTTVSWTQQLAVTLPDILTTPFTVIGMDKFGVVVTKSGAPFTPQEHRDIIVLGAAVHTQGSPIEDIVNDPVQLYNVVHALVDLADALGPIISGSEIQLTNANLTFAQNSGTATQPYINFQTDPQAPSTVTNAGSDPVTFNYNFRDGVGGFTISAATTLVNPTQFDDGTGTLATVSNPNDWTWQIVYFSAIVNRVFVSYGQKTYDTKADAIDGISADFSTYVQNPDLQRTTILGFFVLDEEATDLTDTLTAAFIPQAVIAGGGGGVVIDAYDDLTDTAPSKVGFANNVPIVNAGETNLDYIDAPVLIAKGHADPAITGVIDGGFLTQNGLNQVDITIGTGEIANFYTDYSSPTITPVSFAAQTITIPNLGVDQSSYIFIDSAGLGQSQGTIPTANDLKTKIFLGSTINDTSSTQILAVINTPSVVGLTANAYQEQFHFTGTLIKGGAVSQTNDTVTNGDLALRMESVDLFSPGINWQTSKTDPNQVTFAAVDPVIWFYMLQTGDVIDPTAALIDPLQFDNSGVLALVPTAGAGRRTTIQYLFQALGGTHIILYGQVVYDDLTVALDVLEFDFANLIIPEFLDDFATVVAAILVTQNCVDLADPTTANIQQSTNGTLSGGAAVSLQDAYNTGPTIITDTTLGPIINRIGSAADTDAVLVIENLAAFTVLKITGEGHINVSGPIAIGTSPTTQGTNAISLGNNAGASGQGIQGIAIGVSAASLNQSLNGIAIGASAGSSSQGVTSIAIGLQSGQTSQGLASIAIGPQAGNSNQGAGSIAIGNAAANNAQGAASIAIGLNAAGDGPPQQANGIAIGENAGFSSQRINAIAIGLDAGVTNQEPNSIAIGTAAGNSLQAANAVAIGQSCGVSGQMDSAVAIGRNTGQVNQGVDAIAIGRNAGNQAQGTLSIAIGRDAAQNTPQGTNSVAIGNRAGRTNQQNFCVGIGDNAGEVSQGLQSVAIGTSAGQTTQGATSVAIGAFAGTTNQASNTLAIGNSAGNLNQGDSAVAVGVQAGQTTQAIFSVAIGRDAGQTTQSSESVAIGHSAGGVTQSTNCVAIGHNAGQTSQERDCVAIGQDAGIANQGQFSVAIGFEAAGSAVALENQGTEAVAVGPACGRANQGNKCVAIGTTAGNVDQGTLAVAIGATAGQTAQGVSSVAIGDLAGNANQGTKSIAIGFQAAGSAVALEEQGADAVAIGSTAGNANQASKCIAVGFNAGQTNQGSESIAMGNSCGRLNQGATAVAIGQVCGDNGQGDFAVAIGRDTGKTNQGAGSIALGAFAGINAQGDNGIIISATGVNENQTSNGHIVLASTLASMKYTTALAGFSFDKQTYTPTNTLVDAVTIATDCELSNVHEVTLAGNRTLGAPTNLKDGSTYIWKFTQDVTGTRTLAYNAVFKFAGGTAPTLSTGSGAIDVLTGVSDGTSIFCGDLLKDFS